MRIDWRLDYLTIRAQEVLEVLRRELGTLSKISSNQIWNKKNIHIDTVTGRKVKAESCRITQNKCILGFRTGSLL